MKKFIQRVQDLSQKAAQLKQVVEAAPAQAAQLRDTVLMSAGQLQQMKHEVQSSVLGLKADNEGRLAQALQEIHDHADVFGEAGYELTGVDMEISAPQRLIVHLEKHESVSEATLRSLLSENSGRQTVYALLSALAKAETVSEKVNLSHFTYRELIVHVGPTPTVRLCWRADVEEENAPSAPAAPVAAPPVSSLPPLSAFAPSSFFEQRSSAVAAKPPAVPASSESPAPVPAAVSTTTAAPDEPRSGGDWKASALDRFKKMPDVSKYRR